MDHKSSHFRKIQPVFMNPTNPYESLVLAQNKSLKIRICESLILTNPDGGTRESGFASPNLKDLFCGFVSKLFFSKLLDSF